MNSRIKLLISSFCFSLLLNHTTSAEEVKPLTFDILRSYPFAYINDNGDKVGTYWEYVDLIAAKSRLNITKKIMPKARVISNLKSGRSDSAIFFKSGRLNDHINYIAHVRTIPIIVATHKETVIEHYDDLKRLSTLGVFRSGSVSPRFDNDNDINKNFISSYPNMVKMLAAKRLDAITGNGVVITALINQMCLQDEIVISPLVMGDREQWLVISKQSAYLNQAEILKESIHQLKTEGALDAIFDSHLSRQKHTCD